ncbi:hypothetical protein CBR_g50794 [Chara braunii]|uniref:SAP domain-containing protein n=1 Tax=Chara braunii TaxID=69332 RepID=A0A388K5V6_CHABU|nr:hypothetical protein CBR_g50794 [Chara braunii]|eukprot:GBG65434.1 hypothetical protein CBR_g50794 [Chara braunii]
MKKTPLRKTPSAGRRKIPTAPGSVGKQKVVTDNLRDLENMNVVELKRICLAEGVEYEGKKMQVILAITEKRTQDAYGEEEVRGLDEGVGGNQTDEAVDKELMRKANHELRVSHLLVGATPGCSLVGGLSTDVAATGFPIVL